MAINEELLDFVREALGRGLSRAQIENALVNAGWEKGRVSSALASFADSDLPVPVPRPRVYLSAREAFFYLVIFVTLYTSAYNLGSLLFQFINRAFPIPTQVSAKQINDTIRFSISALVVAFPIFLYVSNLMSRSVSLDPGKRASKVRKWLTYLTLFIVACILIGDFVSLIYNFLGGELTARFALKVLVVGSISGAVFAYYLADLKIEEKENSV